MTTQGLRLAATRLAALHQDDRAWLLAQLPIEQASALRDLLGSRHLKQWAAALGEGIDTLTLPVAPSVKASPKSLPLALKELGVAWQALWLAANHPEDVADRIDGMETWRARRLMEDTQRFEGVLPSGLREALVQWPAARAQSFAEVL
jgi:hypothetical protein